jgi:hypothetical protein
MRICAIGILLLLVLAASPAFALQRVVLFEQFTNSG